MKKSFLVFLLIFPLFLFAQNKAMFGDTDMTDNNTILIGRYLQYDNANTNKAFNFYIDNRAEIKAVLKELTVGEETTNIFGTNSVIISIVHNNKERKSWLIHPDLQLASYDGHTYRFDIRKLKRLHKMYPFDYKFNRMLFATREKYDEYLSQQKANKDFLFAYSPLFRYEGSFEIQFPRNNKYTSPKTISEFLYPIIEKIVAKGTYSVTYAANEKNLKNPNQFTMTIQGTKKLFNDLKIDGLKNENWHLEAEKGTFFYRVR